MAEHFDVVIVGSGFGGSVMAYRLAEAGMRVCVLERGRAYPPGSFPRSPLAMRDNFWVPRQGKFGLFHVWQFRGTDAVVSSGLGGGSLIYANVLLRKDEKWFVDTHADGEDRPWPVSRAQLDPHYDRIETMLNGQRYPVEHSPYSQTPKLNALREAARALGQEWIVPKLAVAFRQGETPGVGLPLVGASAENMFGVPRSTCRLCGECNVGCNYGSKSTLDLTYLSRAKRLGAVIRTGAQVRRFEPRPLGGYTTHYVQRALAPEGEGQPQATPKTITMTSTTLVLAAGTLGSSYLLLKQAGAGDTFASLRPQLGRRFTGNGDLLTFVLGARTDSGDPRRVDATRGPVITSAIRIPDALDGTGAPGRGFYVEDAGFPTFAAWLAEWTVARPTKIRGALELIKAYAALALGLTSNTNLGGRIARTLGDAALSGSSLPLLTMGRDDADGIMRINGAGRLDIEVPAGSSGDFLHQARSQSKRIAGALGGTFMENPLSAHGRPITVHPLGGCRMGHNPSEGVVDSRGEVFGFPGLFVADGSVMPGPVGPNPALTIAALADHFADHIIECKPRSR